MEIINITLYTTNIQEIIEFIDELEADKYIELVNYTISNELTEIEIEYNQKELYDALKDFNCKKAIEKAIISLITSYDNYNYYYQMNITDCINSLRSNEGYFKDVFDKLIIYIKEALTEKEYIKFMEKRVKLQK